MLLLLFTFSKYDDKIIRLVPLDLEFGRVLYSLVEHFLQQFAIYVTILISFQIVYSTVLCTVGYVIQEEPEKSKCYWVAHGYSCIQLIIL